jgi:hypothetical protein
MDGERVLKGRVVAEGHIAIRHRLGRAANSWPVPPPPGDWSDSPADVQAPESCPRAPSHVMMGQCHSQDLSCM